jgi:hypothetical protein
MFFSAEKANYCDASIPIHLFTNYDYPHKTNCHLKLIRYIIVIRSLNMIKPPILSLGLPTLIAYKHSKYFMLEIYHIWYISP